MWASFWAGYDADLNFIAESLLDLAEQWNSSAPVPSNILCRLLSVIPPPVIWINEENKYLINSFIHLLICKKLSKKIVVTNLALQLFFL